MAVLLCLSGHPATAATPAAVDAAVDRGRAWLLGRQHDGNWEIVARRRPGTDPPNDPGGLQYGGMTALATFALLSAGVPPQDPHVRQAVDWLERADLRGTYAIGLRAQVWPLLPQDGVVRKAEAADHKLLIDGLHQRLAGPFAAGNGFFGYGRGMPVYQFDHSVSQFGVLGLWSLQQAGMETDTRYWRLMDRAWRSQRLPDGGWSYYAVPFNERDRFGFGQPRGIGGELLSMTAAGVATLFITQDYANTSAECNGNPKDPDIPAGMAWVAGHLRDLEANEWSRAWAYYTLFGIARIGLASGYKDLGPTDWFQWGSDWLLARQDRAGSWGGDETLGVGDRGESVESGLYDTAFALLFLSRGRAPVLIDKLRYTEPRPARRPGPAELPGNWDERPRDVANITRWVGQQTETALNWQIVNLAEPADDLADAPILYLSGNRPLNLSADEQARLKAFVNQGGLVLGHADCDNPHFAESFRKLAAALFPSETVHPLPADHPIFADGPFRRSAMSPAPTVEAIDNGVRVQMLLLAAGDPARVWQTQEWPRDVRRYPWGQFMLDLYAYVTDAGQLSDRARTVHVGRRDDVQPTRTLKVARLQYNGDWDPEPAGWPRLATILHNDRATDLDVQPVDLGTGHLTSGFALADLTGTAAFTLTDAQRKELADYVAGGGTLLVDAAGGREAFAVAAQTELAKGFPRSPNPIPVLPTDSLVYTAAGPLGEVTYRRYAHQRLGHLNAPRLRGFEVGGRLAVLLSGEDLAAGLVGQPVDGVVGYSPASAVDVAEHVVLYAGR